MSFKKLLNGIKPSCYSNRSINCVNNRIGSSCNYNRFPKNVKEVNELQFFVDSCNRSHSLPSSFVENLNTKKN